MTTSKFSIAHLHGDGVSVAAHGFDLLHNAIGQLLPARIVDDDLDSTCRSTWMSRVNRSQSSKKSK